MLKVYKKSIAIFNLFIFLFVMISNSGIVSKAERYDNFVISFDNQADNVEYNYEEISGNIEEYDNSVGSENIGLRAIDESDYILDESGNVWFKEYVTGYCSTDRYRFYSEGTKLYVEMNVKDAPGYVDTRGLDCKYHINISGCDDICDKFSYSTYELKASQTFDLSTKDDGCYYVSVWLNDFCRSEASGIDVLKKNNRLYFNCIKKSGIEQYNLFYKDLYKKNPDAVLEDVKKSVIYRDMSESLKKKAKEIKSESGSNYRTVLNIKSWLCTQRLSGIIDEEEEVYDLILMLTYLDIPTISYCGHYYYSLVSSFVDNRWVVMSFGWQNGYYPGETKNAPVDGLFDMSIYRLCGYFGGDFYGFDSFNESKWGTFSAENTDNMISIDYSVLYYQTESRKMLSMVNSFRAEDDLWVITKTGKEKISGLNDLEYDYELEKIAMQRAAELAVLFEHERPNTSDFNSAYKGYNYTMAAENIALGYASAEEVLKAWREDEAVTYYDQGHRRNLLNTDYNRIGIACAEYNGVKYWVQEFAYSESENNLTSANDSKTNVNVEIKKDYLSLAIKFKDLNSMKKLYVRSEDEIAFPSIAVEYKLTTTKNTFPINDANISFSSNNDFIEIKNNKILGKKVGDTEVIVNANYNSLSSSDSFFVNVSNNVTIKSIEAPNIVLDYNISSNSGISIDALNLSDKVKVVWSDDTTSDENVYWGKANINGNEVSYTSYIYTSNYAFSAFDNVKYNYDENNCISSVEFDVPGFILYDYNNKFNPKTLYAHVTLIDNNKNKENVDNYVDNQNENSELYLYDEYQGYTFKWFESGDIRCYDSSGNPVINEFKCDGTYTYYFQADGTAMKDRLTYHPDGVHVIYFDSEGHEVFSDFANVKKTISGDEVNDFCFFDVFGYMYVDVLTYDKTGSVLYYANPYGVMEMGKWFQFSDTVMWADGTPAEGIAGGYGYANEDGTLMTNTQTIDWEGRSCYLQGNGVALY